MRLKETSFVALDFETTGVVSGYANEPWQIGLVELHHGCLDVSTQWESYLRIDPARPINPHAPGRHAQLREHLAQSPEPARIITGVGAALTRQGAHRAQLVQPRKKFSDRLPRCTVLAPGSIRLCVPRGLGPI